MKYINESLLISLSSYANDNQKSNHKTALLCFLLWLTLVTVAYILGQIIIYSVSMLALFFCGVCIGKSIAYNSTSKQMKWIIEDED